METIRQEIVQYLIDTKEIEKCVQYRLNKCNNPDWKADLVQECWLWILEYDINKLEDAYRKHHMSALITRFIINQFFSKTSPFYRRHKKAEMLSDEITYKELQIPDE